MKRQLSFLYEILLNTLVHSTWLLSDVSLQLLAAVHVLQIVSESTFVVGNDQFLTA